MSQFFMSAFGKAAEKRLQTEILDVNLADEAEST